VQRAQRGPADTCQNGDHGDDGDGNGDGVGDDSGDGVPLRKWVEGEGVLGAQKKDI
jgi:hypothetical protein